MTTDANTAPGTKAPVPAGLFRRLFAVAYDGMLLFALNFVLGAIAVTINVQISGEPRLPDSLGLLLVIVVTFLFYGWFWTHGGQTLGMRTWRLQVLDGEGGSISWSKAALRFAVALLSWLALGLGWLWILIDRDRAAWHDKLSNSHVVFHPR